MTIEAPITRETLLALRERRPNEPFVFQLRDGTRHQASDTYSFATNGREIALLRGRLGLVRFKLSEIVRIDELESVA